MVYVEPYYYCENCNCDNIKCLFIGIRTYFLVNAFNKKVKQSDFKNIKFLCVTHK